MVSLPPERVVTLQAPLLRRIIAFILDIVVIDFLIISPFSSFFAPLVSSISWTTAFGELSKNTTLTASLVPIIFAIATLAVLYFAVFEYFWQQSIGKMVTGLFVQSKKDRLTFWQCLLRNMELLPVLPFNLLMIVDPMFLLFSGDRLSEKLSSTCVVMNYAYQN